MRNELPKLTSVISSQSEGGKDAQSFVAREARREDLAEKLKAFAERRRDLLEGEYNQMCIEFGKILCGEKAMQGTADIDGDGNYINYPCINAHVRSDPSLAEYINEDLPVEQEGIKQQFLKYVLGDDTSFSKKEADVIKSIYTGENLNELMKQREKSVD